MIHLGPFMINWHGVLTVAGILAGLAVSQRAAVRLGQSRDVISRLAPFLIIAAVVGGRIAYVLSHFGEFAGNLWQVIRIDQGGLGSHGALLFGVLTVYVFARRYGLSAERLLDALAPAVPINYLAMRIGNFLIGELYGDPTSRPWGVVFPDTTDPRHPAQLYDALGQVVALAVLYGLMRRPRRPGELAWITLILTSAVRLVSDLFRTELRVAGPFTLGQLAALATMAIATVLFLRTQRIGGGARKERVEALAP
ncbi:MAG: prolipoprotein diacylglyceryl transferase [bacterium]